MCGHSDTPRTLPRLAAAQSKCSIQGTSQERLDQSLGARLRGISCSNKSRRLKSDIECLCSFYPWNRQRGDCKAFRECYSGHFIKFTNSLRWVNCSNLWKVESRLEFPWRLHMPPPCLYWLRNTRAKSVEGDRYGQIHLWEGLFRSFCIPSELYCLGLSSSLLQVTLLSAEVKTVDFVLTTTLWMARWKSKEEWLSFVQLQTYQYFLSQTRHVHQSS
jgi:hypothetical protein